MPVDPNDFEGILELLEDKLVRTSKGSYIAVEDLRNLVKDTAELRKEQTAEMPRHKTMFAARKAALRDEELIKMFGPPIPPTADARRPDLVKERQAQTAISA